VQGIKKREELTTAVEEATGFADFNKSLDPTPNNLIVGEFVVDA
jgi:hypothetical protein